MSCEKALLEVALQKSAAWWAETEQAGLLGMPRPGGYAAIPSVTRLNCLASAR